MKLLASGLLVAALASNAFAQNLVADPTTSNAAVGGETQANVQFNGTLTDNVVGATATSVSDGAGGQFLGSGISRWNVDLWAPGVVAGQTYFVTISGIVSSATAQLGDIDNLLVSNGPGTFALSGSSASGTFAGTFTAVDTATRIGFEVQQSRAGLTNPFTWSFTSMDVRNTVPEMDKASAVTPLTLLGIVGLILAGRKRRAHAPLPL